MSKKILLTGVCRPIGPECGDASSVGYELLHGQVTRVQGMFSPRANHLHYSLEYIAENLETPAVVLHYPSRRELIRELKKGYDYVAITFVLAVFRHVKEAVALIREHSPQSKIILGGYGTVLPDEVLKPYADYICREEGVGFMRRLLGEPEIPMPYKHPLIVSRLKVFSKKVSKTGLIFGGLGCPNGCDFCCTSHFFKRKHIRLLPTGKDIYTVVERYLDLDPNMVFTMLDEDFLLNKKRALEFRDCVLKGGRPLSMFVFSSVKAISQFTVEEIFEMGIDGFWIGYEGERSGFAKREGRPVEELFREFREHGITILSSMILGLPYQTPEVIQREMDGLTRLKPALSQFMIYSTSPGTPFYDRVISEGLLREDLAGDIEEYCRTSDGFTATVRHPSMTPEQIESLQRRCFEEDYRRLGPSIYRTLETWFLGYKKLIRSENPLLRLKAGRFAHDIRKGYPIFLAGRLFGPNRHVRRWIAGLEREIYQTLGRPTLKERLLSVTALAFAVWTGLKLKLKIFQHPRLTRHAYRIPYEMSGLDRAWRRISERFSKTGFPVSIEPRPGQVIWVKFDRAVSAENMRKLGLQLQEALKRRRDHLVLDLAKLSNLDEESAKELVLGLGGYLQRVRLVAPLTFIYPRVADWLAHFRPYC